MSKKKNKKKTLLDKLLYYFVIFILGALTGYIYEVIFYYITLGVLNNCEVLKALQILILQLQIAKILPSPSILVI